MWICTIFLFYLIDKIALRKHNRKKENWLLFWLQKLKKKMDKVQKVTVVHLKLKKKNIQLKERNWKNGDVYVIIEEYNIEAQIGKPR